MLKLEETEALKLSNIRLKMQILHDKKNLLDNEIAVLANSGKRLKESIESRLGIDDLSLYDYNENTFELTLSKDKQ